MAAIDPTKITVTTCGPGSAKCKCACPDGPCEHDWTGPGEESDDGRTWSATCSRCGKSAMAHSMWVGP